MHLRINPRGVVTETVLCHQLAYNEIMRGVLTRGAARGIRAVSRAACSIDDRMG